MNTTATAPAAEAPATEAPAEDSGKEAIYTKIADLIKEKTDKRIGKTGGREIFDLVVSEVFAAAAAAGTFRFNGGFGSMHVKKYSAGSRRLPSGQETTFGEREKLRYEEGVVTKELVKNGGDLVEAIKVRGTRAPKAETATATPAAASAATPAAAPADATAEEAGADLDLG